MSTIWGAILDNTGGTATQFQTARKRSGATRLLGEPVNELTRIDEGATVNCGVPLAGLFIRQVDLPRVEGQDVEESARLQVAFHLPYEADTAVVRHQVREVAGGYKLLIVATRRPTAIEPNRLLPAPAALVALGHARNAIPDRGTCLLVHLGTETTTTVTLEDGEIVFMRTMPAKESSAHEFRMSAQAVYLRRERTVVEPDQVVAFAESASNPEVLAELSGAFESDVTLSGPDDFLQIESGDVPAHPDLLLHLGLALATSRTRGLVPWSLSDSANSGPRMLSRPIVALLAISPFLLVGALHALTWANQRDLADVEAQIETVRPLYERVTEIRREAQRSQTFLETSGARIRTPESWFLLLDAVERSRPVGVHLSTIAGRAYESVLIGGRAPSYDLVPRYLTALDRSPHVRSASLLFTRETRDDEVDFQITVEMPLPALPAAADDTDEHGEERAEPSATPETMDGGGVE